MYRCLTNGLSFKVGGGNVLTLCPPLTITERELDAALDILHGAVAASGHDGQVRAGTTTV
jgi:4-aminobutyrate aminotransferase